MIESPSLSTAYSALTFPLLEPYEAAFILDVTERGLRDMLAVTTEFQDKSIEIPDYQLLQRKVSHPLIS